MITFAILTVLFIRMAAKYALRASRDSLHWVSAAAPKAPYQGGEKERQRGGRGGGRRRGNGGRRELSAARDSPRDEQRPYFRQPTLPRRRAPRPVLLPHLGPPIDHFQRVGPLFMAVHSYNGERLAAIVEDGNQCVILSAVILTSVTCSLSAINPRPNGAFPEHH